MYAEVNGTRLYYERRGAGRPILFVHGATLDHRMWAPQVAALADRFDVIAYDLRGYGRSAPPGPVFKHCEDAAALLDHLGITGAIVVGQSIGALYALELCFARPELVSAFAAVCMSALGEPPFPGELVAKIGQARQAARAGDLAEAKARWLATGWFDSALARPDVAPQIEAMLADYSGCYWTADVPALNLDPPAVTRLERLHVPALVVDGELDLPYNHEIAAVLARRLPRARFLRLPGAGHMANLEAPEPVNAAIAALAP